MNEVPEGWAVVKLGDIVEVLDKYRIPLDEEYRRTIPGPYPYCGATGIIDYINDYIFDGEYLLVAEDGGKYGPFEETAYIMRGKFWANNHVHILKGKSGVVENVFLMYYLNLIDVRKHILGTTREKLNQEALRNIPILKPPLPEQRKIAEVLSKVDSLIERTEKIIEKYERIKRGLAQDLLTRGIDENGRIRSEETHEFKDSPIGRIPKEWKVVKIGSITQVLRAGGTPSRDVKEFWGGTIPFVLIEDMTSSNKYLTKVKETITEKGLKNSSAWLVPPNSILFSMYASLGEVVITTFPVATNQAILAMILKPEYDTEFIYYVLEFNKQKWEKYVVQTTQKNLNRALVSQFEIAVPISLSEQRRIAQVLSQVDSILDKERRELEKLKRLKRGLMDDLLSGKIRVTPLLEGETV